MRDSRGSSTMTATSVSQRSSSSTPSQSRQSQPGPLLLAGLWSLVCRTVPLSALVMVVFSALSWLQHPSIAYLTTLFLAAFFGASTARSYQEGDSIFRVTLGPTILLSACLLMSHLDVVASSFLVSVIGFFGVLFAVFLSLVSNYIGRARFQVFSYILTAVSLLCPLVLGAIAVTLPYPNGSRTYALGIMTSVTASGVNIFYNKSPQSVGFASL